MARYSKSYFSDARIALTLEVKKHEKLVEILADFMRSDNGNDWPDTLAVIAQYLGIELDIMCTPSDIEKLEHILYTKLVDSRKIILN